LSVSLPNKVFPPSQLLFLRTFKRESSFESMALRVDEDLLLLLLPLLVLVLLLLEFLPLDILTVREDLEVGSMGDRDVVYWPLLPLASRPGSSLADAMDVK
jgi:hypothetical protein